MPRQLKQMQSLLQTIDSMIANPQANCVEWTHGTSHDGYGRVWNGNKFIRTHRIALERKLGRPLTLHALHHCDNTLCYNPSHLFEGSDADNIADKVKKGRGSIGHGHGRAKLADTDVRMIRTLSAASVPSIDLAKRYMVSQASISLIVNRKSWTHI